MQIKSYKSRRNQATLHEIESMYLVRKEFKNENRLYREKSVYQKLEHSNLSVPKIIKEEDNVLWLSYLPGITLLEVLEEQERKNVIELEIWSSLAEWMIRFVKETGLIMGDVNLRNFIYDSKTHKVSGFDFEECKDGELLEMAADLIAFISLYDPMETDVKIEISTHLKNYFLYRNIDNQKKFEKLVEEKKELIKQRRILKIRN